MILEGRCRRDRPKKKRMLFLPNIERRTSRNDDDDDDEEEEEAAAAR